MKRENNLDFLRVLACILVISIHVSAFFVTKFVEEPNLKFTIGNFYDSFSRIAVPIFVLLSGRFALSDEKNINIKFYYKKIFFKIIIPTLIWSFLYFLYNYILEIAYYILYGELKHSLYSPIKAWIVGAPFYHLWYLYMSIGLYLAVPFLIKIKNKVGENNFFKIGIIFFILGLFIFLFENFLNYINFYERNDIFKYLKYFWYFNQFKFINFLGYFILGYSLKNIKNKYINFKNMFFSAIVVNFFLFLTVEYFTINKIITNPLIFYNNNFIFVMIISILIYLAFDKLDSQKVKFDFSNLAFHSFNIYLIHAGLLLAITTCLEKILNYEPNPIWYIPFMIFFIFISSYSLSLFIKKLKSLFFNKRISLLSKFYSKIF